MSRLSEYLNEVAKERSLDSAQQFADAAGLSKSVAHALLTGRSPRSATLAIVADNLDLPLARLHELAGLPEPGEPFVLPSEFNALRASQRRVVLAVGRELLKANASAPD
jgi:transcriptional regulator with XRE-family HTH domain